MFVRCKKRFKDGKEHRYWSVVENVRVSGGRVVQRQVLYLGEINDSQRAAWCRSIEVVEGASRSKQVALFPEDREAPELECEVVQVRLAQLTLHAPRQWGACWLALTLWERLELDRFWGPRLPASREGTRWLDILKIQVCYRLIDPGSDWRLHRQWYEHSALLLPVTLFRSGFLGLFLIDRGSICHIDPSSSDSRAGAVGLEGHGGATVIAMITVVVVKMDWPAGPTSGNARDR